MLGFMDFVMLIIKVSIQYFLKNSDPSAASPSSKLSRSIMILNGGSERVKWGPLKII